jgi:hypothetical protein
MRESSIRSISFWKHRLSRSRLKDRRDSANTQARAMDQHQIIDGLSNASRTFFKTALLRMFFEPNKTITTLMDQFE